MSSPKFSVGEVVILQNVMYPHYNGEYTIKKVSSCYYYQTPDGPVPGDYKYSLGFIRAEDNSEFFGEPALRKKHDGCGQSFQELLSCLNTNIKEKA